MILSRIIWWEGKLVQTFRKVTWQYVLRITEIFMPFNLLTPFPGICSKYTIKEKKGLCIKDVYFQVIYVTAGGHNQNILCFSPTIPPKIYSRGNAIRRKKGACP